MELGTLLSILGLIMSILGLLVTSFALADSTNFRLSAEKHPGTIAYWWVKFYDSFLRSVLSKKPPSAIESRKKRHEDASSSKQGSLPRVHDFIGVNEMISVRQSFCFSLDLTTRLSGFLLNRVAQPTLPFAFGQLCVLLGLFLGYASWRLSGNWFAGIMVIIFIILNGVLVWFALFRPGGFVHEMQKLYYRPFLLLNVDDRLISFESGWGRMAFRNSADIEFKSISGEFTLGIGFIQSTDEPPITIFSYHRFLEQRILNEAELIALCKRLNWLAEQARMFPKIAFDQIQV